MNKTETGFTADLVFRNGGFESGIAMFTDESGQITRFSRDPGDLARAHKFGQRAILPGLVNAHSHAFQRAIRGLTESPTAGHDTFWTWRDRMYRAANQLSPDDIYDVARMAFLEMLCSGITTVGEFHYLHNAPGGARYADPNLLSLEVLRAACDTAIGIVLLRVAYARAGFEKSPNPLQARFITGSADAFIADTEALRKFARVAIAPHSVRAVPLDYLREVIHYAQLNDLPVHMHVAEQPAEIEESIAEYGVSPVELLSREVLLNSRFTAVHGIHLTEQEIHTLGEANASVCACPTTERNLGDGAVPADRLLCAGARICFGSDSNIQIDLLEDARSLEYHLRMKSLSRAILAPESLFTAATQSAVVALGISAGTLEPGHPADFFTLDLNDLSLAGAQAQQNQALDECLLANIVFCAERTAVRDVFVAGRRVLEDGRHPHAREIVEKFTAVQRRLWST